MGKGKLWCVGLSRITVPLGPPKPVTFVIPYYENPLFLDEQFHRWCSYRDDLARYVSAIIVDDGSPVPARLPDTRPFPMTLYRIEQDVRWNWLAARNIGAHHAHDGWLLLTDIDHVVPEKTLQAVVYGQHDPKFVYAFSRREHTGEVIGPHSASFLMTKEMFWSIGGYDERFSGYYGTDGVYRRRLQEHATVRLLKDELIRFEYFADSSTRRYLRKQPEDAAVSQIAAKIPKGSKPKVLSFAYHEVTA